MKSTLTLFCLLALASTADAAPTRRVRTPCQSYSDELSFIAATDEREIFKEQKAVTSVLAFFDSAKGDSPTYRQMLRVVASKLPDISDEDFANVFYEAPPCNAVMSEYKALAGLLVSTKAFKLEQGVQDRVRKMTTDYLKLKVSSPGTFLETSIHMSLLRKLMDEGYLKPTPEQIAKIAALRKEGDTAREQLRALPINKEDKWPASRKAFRAQSEEKKMKFVEMLKIELQKSEELRKRMQTLYRELGIIS